MKTLFDQTELNGLRLKNRFVRSATWEGLAGSDGRCTGGITRIMEDLAKGQVALLITSHAYVHPSGQAGFQQLGIYDDGLMASYADMVEKVHNQGSKTLLQIAHAGCRSARNLTHASSLGPSSITSEQFGSCEQMSEAEIKNSVNDFTEAAIRAGQIGFDGIQIHAAHGYLLSQFLSPYFNHRKDQYGGNLVNRARFILEIVRLVRAKLGLSFIVTVKINSEDYIENGFSVEDMIQTCLLMQTEGVNAIELSGSIGLKSAKYGSSRLLSGDSEPYYEKAAALFKKNLSIPLILVGGIRSFQTAKRLIEEEKTDYISMSRPLVREPGLVKRWQEEKRKKASCISCNRCFEPIKRGEGVYCVIERLKKKKTRQA